MDLIRANGFEVAVLPAAAPADHADATRGDRDDWLQVHWEVDARETTEAMGNFDAEWLIVDHYGIDGRWELGLRPHVRWMLAIDDLADRSHETDFLLDQNAGRKEGDYAGLLGGECLPLLGPRYALLRPDFASLRNYSLRRRAGGDCKSIVVCMGSMDSDNATGEVLQALSGSRMLQVAEVAVVLGARAPWLDSVRNQAKQSGLACRVLVDVEEMAELLAKSDLAIGAMGTSALERCALGLPTLGVVTAQNQYPGAVAMAEAGAVRLLPPGQGIRVGLGAILSRAMDRNELLEMSAAAAALCDGLGVARVVRVVADHAAGSGAVRIRRMEAADLEDVFAWRNDPEVRRHMHTRHEITIEEHRAWFARCGLEEGRELLIVEEGQDPLGFVQFARLGPRQSEWGFYLRPGAPKGSGRKLGRAALDYAFAGLRQTAVHGKVLRENSRSIAFHTSLGFVEVQNSGDDAVRSFMIEAADWRKQ